MAICISGLFCLCFRRRDALKRTGVMISKLGASKAISIGAYTYALSQIDQKEAKEA